MCSCFKRCECNILAALTSCSVCFVSWQNVLCKYELICVCLASFISSGNYKGVVSISHISADTRVLVRFMLCHCEKAFSSDEPHL